MTSLQSAIWNGSRGTSPCPHDSQSRTPCSYTDGYVLLMEDDLARLR